ncbi:MAG: hypothetical protein HKN25_07670 [Pyrinomonadaceae bacterium]|nr:hypothetical protein [Pyrinomonadaceae bacterium]
MAVATKRKKTEGMEKLEFLTDKATRLVYELEAEEKQMSEMRRDLLELQKQKESIAGENNAAKLKLSSLQEEKEIIDKKISTLLEALNKLSIEE